MPLAPAFALARLSVAGCTPFAALVSGHQMLPLAAIAGLNGAASLDALLARWEQHEPWLAGVDLRRCGAPLAGCRVHAPLQPRQVYCSIGNYQGQLLQAALDADPQADLAALRSVLARRQAEGAPYVAIKPASTVADPMTALAMAPALSTLDWEVEIGVVIARAAHRIRPDQAMQHVAGYCTVNDITLRERLFRADPPAMGTDFLQAKGGPGWLPLGPWLVPSSQVPDPTALRLTLQLNGHTMQDGLASDMLFGIAEQIAYLSQHVLLQPGDLICTGSPAGFGSHHRRFLRPGDLVEAEVHGLGRQHTRITTLT